MSERLFGGVDPGRDGALAVVDSRGRLVKVEVPDWLIPAPGGLRLPGPAMRAEVGRLCGVVAAWAIEEPILYRQGEASIAKSARSVAVSVGVWVGLLAAWGATSVQLVQPMAWQRHLFGRVVRGTSKETAARLAETLWGRNPLLTRVETWHDGRVDAALIAEYLRQREALRFAAAAGG